MPKLTKRTVDAAEIRSSRYVLFDDEVKGFGLRVFPSGEKSWIVEYRPNGGGRGVSKRRFTLGSAGTLTPDAARRAAKDALASVRFGSDPARAKEAARKSVTVADLAQRFLADHVDLKRKPGTAQQYRHLLEDFVVPALGSQKAEAVTRREMSKLHAGMQDKPYQANRMLAVMGAMYTFAGKRGMVPETCNPVRGIEKYREHRRERFLTPEELERIGAALREAETVGIAWDADETGPNAKHLAKAENRRTVLGVHPAAAIRLLILTGARLREILHLRWEHVDLGRGLLFLPDSKTGRKTIVLNAPALLLLADLPRFGSYVIAGDNHEKPRADLHRPWKMIAKRAGLEAVRIHDLRHTFASFGAGSGLGLPILGKLLGHKEVATTQRYAHLDNDPLRRATNEIGGQIAKALG